MLPVSTPGEVLYKETGLLEPDTIIKRNRILMENRIRKGETEITKKRIEMDQKGGWKEKKRTLKKK